MQTIKFIFFGIIAALGSLFVEMLIYTFLFPDQSAPVLMVSLTTPLVLYAIIEELFKLAFIYKIHSDTKDRFELLKNSLLIGLGFGLTEISFVPLTSPTTQPGFWLAIAGIIVVHLATAGLFGYIIGKISAQKRIITLISVAIITICLHLIYNSLVIYSAGAIVTTAYLLALLLLIFFALIKLRQN